MVEIKTIESKIKEIIIDRGLQQKFICEKIKISQEQFSQCLRGKRKLKAVEFLAVCSLLGLNLSDFEECQQ